MPATGRRGNLDGLKSVLENGPAMSRYWSPIVHELAPYVPGEQPQDRRYIKLNTNENPYPPSPAVMNAIRTFEADPIRHYPDPESRRLREALARRHGVDIGNVFVGNGSDEVLAHAFQAFFCGKPPLAFPAISYSFYPVYCRLYGIEYRAVPLRDDFTIAIDDYAGEGPVVLPNPNAPTGRLLPLESIATLCRAHPTSVVVVDEAYIDFGGESAVPLTGSHENLLVVQTFSKSRSLAGLRVGYAIGHADLVEALVRVKDSFNSYPLDAIAQAAAVAALDDDAYFARCRQAIIDDRERLRDGLEALGFEVLPSAANFLFVRHPGHRACDLYAGLKADGILVRHFGQPAIEDFLRITVGTRDDCDRLIERLAARLG